jgi:hypothetical protein
MEVWSSTAKGVLLNFVFMAIAFSINHGTVTALLGYASSTLGTELGKVSYNLLS